MTHLLQDILRQPAELQRSLTHLQGSARNSLTVAATAVRQAREVYVTGIGASWNAVLAAGACFYAEGRPVYMLDASELLLTSKMHADVAIILISRSGASAEIVKLLAKAREARSTTIGITNFSEGRLALQSDIPIVVPVAPDHGISVCTYSSLAMAATMLACIATQVFHTELADTLARSLDSLAEVIPEWRHQLAESAWLSTDASYYFLARGSSLASASEARLLWEEGAKTQATAMGTDSFRHGPQEVVTARSRIAIWIHQQTREQDLALARDLRRVGAQVMLIGRQLPADAGDLIFQVPPAPMHWQFLLDVVPAQLAVEKLAEIAGVDCDSFRFASYIVDQDTGLALGKNIASPHLE
jgi:glutamine---fructose-6-phosphate transaminase (isomerizing)